MISPRFITIQSQKITFYGLFCNKAFLNRKANKDRINLKQNITPSIQSTQSLNLYIGISQ